jgi:DNA (cytosine-5)-methyltransferase 1
MYPNQEKECSLLDFCEKKLKAKYLLSTKQILKLFANACPEVKVAEFTHLTDLELHLQAVVEDLQVIQDYTSCPIPIKSKTKSGYQLAHHGDSVDIAFADRNSRRGRVGYETAHTITTSPTQSIYFIDMNVNPRLTQIARCITTRQCSGISKHKAEHSGVFVIIKEIMPNEILSLGDDIAKQWEFENTYDKPITALIVTNSKGQCYLGYIKKLEPIECWRLQGFTDEQFNKVVENGIKDTQLYKMAGNAVSVPVISVLGRFIKQIQEVR